MAMTRFTTIEVNKENMKFSAAHFTIFSATERERLHGHNYSVFLAITAPVNDNGMCFSYGEIKDRVRAICDSLDEYTLLPEQSPYLRLEREGDYWKVGFADEVLWFLASDVLVLPIRNATVEEFARYLLERVRQDESFLRDNGVTGLTVKVSSGPGQCGSASWQQ